LAYAGEWRSWLAQQTVNLLVGSSSLPLPAIFFMAFTPKFYGRLTSKLQKRYKVEVSKFIPQAKKSLPWIKKFDLKKYSPEKWYFLKQVETYLSFEKILPKLSTQVDSFTKTDDLVFEKWNKSEFADVFLKSLNKGKSISEATQFALSAMSDHLETLAMRLFKNSTAKSPYYRVQSSLGQTRSGQLKKSTLSFSDKDLVIMGHSNKEVKEFSNRIESALNVIQKFSPDSWERFSAFTNVIIPISEEEFVSYSHQELPGYSMINLYNRDFIDLMDDLLHENGHHHLNYYLNLGKLLDEPSECKYYSPWRRSLRPLRGIYHAFFTFSWAFKLFAALADKYPGGEKIYWRVVEEYWMLTFTFKDLRKAHEQGLIKKQGWLLIESQYKELQSYKSKIKAWEKKLVTHKKDLAELKELLS